MPGLCQRPLLPGSQLDLQQQVAFRSLLYGTGKTTFLEKLILELKARRLWAGIETPLPRE
jgi:hypothetical protein